MKPSQKLIKDLEVLSVIDEPRFRSLPEVSRYLCGLRIRLNTVSSVFDKFVDHDYELEPVLAKRWDAINICTSKLDLLCVIKARVLHTFNNETRLNKVVNTISDLQELIKSEIGIHKRYIEKIAISKMPRKLNTLGRSLYEHSKRLLSGQFDLSKIQYSVTSGNNETSFHVVLELSNLSDTQGFVYDTFNIFVTATPSKYFITTSPYPVRASTIGSNSLSNLKQGKSLLTSCLAKDNLIVVQDIKRL